MGKEGASRSKGSPIGGKTGGGGFSRKNDGGDTKPVYKPQKPVGSGSSEPKEIDRDGGIKSKEINRDGGVKSKDIDRNGGDKSKEINREGGVKPMKTNMDGGVKPMKINMDGGVKPMEDGDGSFNRQQGSSPQEESDRTNRRKGCFLTGCALPMTMAVAAAVVLAVVLAF